MPMHNKPYVPHRNLIKALHLAGIPLTGNKSIVKILNDYCYKPFETEIYQEVFDEIESVPGACPMIAKNRIIHDSNLSVRSREDREPLEIDKSVIRTFSYPLVCEDLMNSFSQNGIKITGLGKPVIRILGNEVDRKNIEILLMKGLGSVKIAEVLNESGGSTKSYNGDQISAYYHYFWNCRIIGDEGSNMSEVANYMAIKTKSDYYNAHTNLIYLSMNETLSSMGYLGEDVRGNINKKIYGMATNEIIDNLRTRTRVKDYIFKLYAHTDASIAEDKRNSNMEEVRDQLAAVFKNIEGIKEKRMSISDIQKEHDNIEPEQDEIVTFKR